MAGTGIGAAAAAGPPAAAWGFAAEEGVFAAEASARLRPIPDALTSLIQDDSDAYAAVLAAMLAMWWLVASTNREGTHDAELLPLIALFPAFSLYVSWRGRRLMDLVVRSLAAWALVFALGILVSFLMHQSASVSRLWAATWFGSAALALAGVRLAAYAVLGAARDRGLDRKRVLLVGFGALAAGLWTRKK